MEKRERVRRSAAGVRWPFLPASHGTPTTTNWGSDDRVSSQAEAAGQSDVRIRFLYTATWDWYWMVDDVEVRASLPATPLTITPSPVGTTTASGGRSPS